MSPDPTIPVQEVAEITGSSSGWAELAERTLLEGDFSLLSNSDIPIGEDSYELLEKDENIAQAELVWVKDKVALFYKDGQSEIDVFEKDGWKCFVELITTELVNEIVLF
jgi:hypothetical protein